MKISCNFGDSEFYPDNVKYTVPGTAPLQHPHLLLFVFSIGFAISNNSADLSPKRNLRASDIAADNPSIPLICLFV